MSSIDEKVDVINELLAKRVATGDTSDTVNFEHATGVDPGGESSNYPMRLTLSITYAAVRAWKMVRDGQYKYDPTKFSVGIAVSPSVYLAIAAINDALKMGDDEGTTAGAMRDGLEAISKNGTGPSRMQWAELGVYPDPRVEYMAVSIFQNVSGTHEPQVFNAEKFAALEASLEDGRRMDALVAKEEKMMALSSVSGQVGRA